MTFAARIVFASAAFVMIFPPQSRAWWDMGHMIIAAAAYDQLTPSARYTAARLLLLNPEFERWTKGISASQRDRIAFIRAATWADDIKGRRDYQHNSVEADGDSAFANIGYADHRMHDYWHSVYMPFSTDGSPGDAPAKPNALTQISTFLASLESDASDDVKSYDLVWLLHLIGDVHQPLHTTSRFSRRFHKGDRGGKEETICLALTCGTTLHSFWDGLLGNKGSAEDAAMLATKLPTPNPTLAARIDPEEWVAESAALAQKVVYAKSIGDGAGPFSLDREYQEAARHVAQSRAALAGARLARVLNSALAAR